MSKIERETKLAMYRRYAELFKSSGKVGSAKHLVADEFQVSMSSVESAIRLGNAMAQAKRGVLPPVNAEKTLSERCLEIEFLLRRLREDINNRLNS